jgi:hypothetical protein
MPTLVELYPSQKTIDQLKALYKHQAEQAGQPDDVWIPPPSLSERNARITSLAWQQCYELAWANCGQPGVGLVELVRENDSATPEDVLEAIEASNKTGKPLDNELASFLD